MATYQNIFTRVQIHGAPDLGVPLPGRGTRRGTATRVSHLFGMIGDAQIGPIYLGWTGVTSLICGLIAFEIIGFNMLASVNWDPVRFVRELFWLQLAPPGPQYGFSPFVPLKEGGWFIIAGFFFTVSVLLWWVRTYNRARALGMGTHVAWAFAGAIWLMLVLGFIRPMLMGSWSEAVPYGVFPHLDWTQNFSLRYGNLFYNPFHALSIVFLPSRAMAATARSSRSSTVARRPSAPPCSGAGRWASTRRWSRSIAGPGGSPC